MTTGGKVILYLGKVCACVTLIDDACLQHYTAHGPVLCYVMGSHCHEALSTPGCPTIGGKSNMGGLG